MPPSLANFAPSGKTYPDTVKCSKAKNDIDRTHFKPYNVCRTNSAFSSVIHFNRLNHFKFTSECKEDCIRKLLRIQYFTMSNIALIFVFIFKIQKLRICRFHILPLFIMLALHMLPPVYSTPISKSKTYMNGVKIYENVNGKFVEGNIDDEKIHLSAKVLLDNKFNPEISIQKTFHKISKNKLKLAPTKTEKNIKNENKILANTVVSKMVVESKSVNRENISDLLNKVDFIFNVGKHLSNHVLEPSENISNINNSLEYNSSKTINNVTKVYDDKIIRSAKSRDKISGRSKVKIAKSKIYRKRREANRKSEKSNKNRKHRNTDIYGDLKSDDIHADKSNLDADSRSSFTMEHNHDFDNKERKETSAHHVGSSVSVGSSNGKDTVSFGSQIRSQTSDRDTSNHGSVGSGTVGHSSSSSSSTHGISSESSKRVTRIVQSRYGRLQGLVVQPSGTYAKRLQPVQAFLGVPYATPPVNNNRFSPTRAPSPWPGLLLAQKHAPVCPQRLPDISNFTASLQQMPRGRYDYLKRLLPYLQNQSEDCLYLNVYAPANEPTSPHKYPVLVFIHGESYEWNSGNPYDGSVLAAYADLVVVTLNYRLGILGFLNANPSPGRRARVANYGLMDQIAALHWIQQNVALFGGDPESVTLMGHGTGAACIHFLMASPAVVPGLFHRAVLMSGSALGAWALVQRPVEYALKLARQVNCTPPLDMSREHESIVDCLREVPLALLLSAQVEPPKYLSAFGPSVDGVVIRSDFARDLLRRPSGFAGQGSSSALDYSGSSDWAGQLRSAGGSAINTDGSSKGQDRLGPVPHGQNKYDLLFGVVTSESLMRFSASDVQSGFEGNRRDRILRTYVRNAYTRHLSEIFYTVANEYTDWERTVQHPINTRDATVAALSDAQFVAPLVQTADLMISSRTHIVSSNSGTKSGSESVKEQNGETDDGGMKAYFYVFDYQTKDGDYPQRMGSVHGEELAYIFGAPLVDGFSHFPRNYTKSELALSEAVLIYWANFARTGNPNEVRKQEQVLPVSRERNRFRSIVWEQYDPVHQKYLEIGMKPRLKNHFRAHQLSVWLRLVPELHRSGSEDAGTRHNLFRHHSDPNLYDGPVRQLKDDAGNILTDDFDDLPVGSINVIGNSNNNNGLDGPGLYGEYVTCITPTVAVNGMFNIQLSNSTNLNSIHNNNQDTEQQAPPPSLHSDNAGYSAYSTALSVTIAVGCSLLILNVLIFAGVYYQRDKTRLEAKTVQQRGPTGATILNQSGALPHQGDHFMEATIVPSKRYVGSDVTNVRSDVDVERDVNALIMADTQRLRHLANSAVKSCNQTSTLPRNVAASQMMRQSDCLTLPRHAAGVIAEMQQTHNSGRFSTLQHNQQNATNGPPNGSVPRPPPPPRCHSPTEHRPQQQLLQQQLLQQQQQQQMQQTATLGRSQNRVPQAALSEMRKNLSQV